MAREAAVAEYFVHPAALCETSQVGDRTRVWAFAHVLPGARIGSDCNICDHVFIENDVIVGDRVTVKSGVQLWDGLRIGDDVFVGPNVTFTNDPFPRSRHWQPHVVQTRINHGASIGANATILPGVVIGREAMIGAGAVVTKDVPANAIAYGNPARIHGYAGTKGQPGTERDRVRRAVAPEGDVDLPGEARLLRLTRADDMRGSLVALELDDALPFVPRRTFCVFDVPSTQIRGEHAHRACHQFLTCIRGSVSILVDDGHRREELVLDDPGVGLYIPPMVWGSQFGYSRDAVLMVHASEPYDPADYIRDYEAFRQLVGIELEPKGEAAETQRPTR